MDEELPPIYDKHYIYMLVFVYCYNFLQMQNTLKKDSDLLMLMVSFVLGKDAAIRDQTQREFDIIVEKGKEKRRYTKSTNFIDYLKDKPEIVKQGPGDNGKDPVNHTIDIRQSSFVFHRAR